jgi:hypothetical protein
MLGSLYVMSPTPRKMSQNDADLLVTLAGCVVAELGLFLERQQRPSRTISESTFTRGGDGSKVGGEALQLSTVPNLPPRGGVAGGSSISINVGPTLIQQTSSLRHTDNAFVFRNCYFTVGKGAKKKDILKGISGEVHSGHVLAVMGEI